MVLVEPLLDPAVEAQALGRVNRIGQSRDTWVHRFVARARPARASALLKTLCWGGWMLSQGRCSSLAACASLSCYAHIFRGASSQRRGHRCGATHARR